MVFLGDEAIVDVHFNRFGDSANLDANRCTVYAKHTIVSEMILDAHDGTPW
jgi:hypothetical protein